MSTVSPARQRRATPNLHAERCEPLGCFTDDDGRKRELIWRRGAEGTTLVIDRLASSRADERLVAHLAADERHENARIVALLYLDDESGRHCRRVTLEDLTANPFARSAARPAATSCEQSPARAAHLTDSDGAIYSLAIVPSVSGLPQLRWRRRLSDAAVESDVVSVREVIGSLESYEPARAMTEEALAAHRRGRRVSTAVLGAELERVLESSIVLSRGLREAVLAAVDERDLTLSQIAIRCGRVKRDRHGNEAGSPNRRARGGRQGRPDAVDLKRGARADRPRGPGRLP